MDQVVKVFESIIKTDESITMQDQLPLQFIGHGVVLFFENLVAWVFQKRLDLRKIRHRILFDVAVVSWREPIDLVFRSEAGIISEIVFAIERGRQRVTMGMKGEDDVSQIFRNELDWRSKLVQTNCRDDGGAQQEFAFDILETSEPDVLNTCLLPDLSRNSILRASGFPAVREDQVMGKGSLVV